MRCLTVLLLCACCGFGAEPTGDLISAAEWEQSAPVSATGPATGATVGQAVPLAPSVAGLVGGLVVVLGLALALGWAAKRLGMRRLMQGRGKHLQAIETIPIGFKRQATLVRLGDQVVLVGIGEHECCHLGTFPASILGEVPAPSPTQPLPAPAPAPSAFATVLTKLNAGPRP